MSLVLLSIFTDVTKSFNVGLGDLTIGQMFFPKQDCKCIIIIISPPKDSHYSLFQTVIFMYDK